MWAAFPGDGLRARGVQAAACLECAHHRRARRAVFPGMATPSYLISTQNCFSLIQRSVFDSPVNVTLEKGTKPAQSGFPSLAGRAAPAPDRPRGLRPQLRQAVGGPGSGRAACSPRHLVPASWRRSPHLHPNEFFFFSNELRQQDAEIWWFACCTPSSSPTSSIPDSAAPAHAAGLGSSAPPT